jgi:hypothetical protein
MCIGAGDDTGLDGAVMERVVYVIVGYLLWGWALFFERAFELFERVNFAGGCGVGVLASGGGLGLNLLGKEWFLLPHETHDRFLVGIGFEFAVT